jgi:hypothetical protein
MVPGTSAVGVARAYSCLEDLLGNHFKIQGVVRIVINLSLAPNFKTKAPYPTKTS